LPPILLSKVGRGVVLFGPAARLLSPSGRCFLLGHAARAFSPSGHCSLWACGPGFFSLRAFCLRRGTFCSPKKFLKNGSLRWPCGAFASLATLLELSSPVSISEGRGALCKTWGVSAMPFEATSKHTPHLQPSWSHSKQPRKTPFTRNPLGASLTCLHQRGSRSAVRNMKGVSNALCIQPRVFDTRLSNACMPALHYLMPIYELTKSNAELALQQHYVAAC